jgi:hypothetical protein
VWSEVGLDDLCDEELELSRMVTMRNLVHAGLLNEDVQRSFWVMKLEVDLMQDQQCCN